MNAQHLMKSHDHGTPPEFIELAQATLGVIDVDPASSEKWNKRIKARRVITEDENGLRTPWFDGAPSPLQLRTRALRPAAGRAGPGTFFTNPPSDKRGELVANFWWACAEYFKLGWATAGIYVGFSVEQLSRLQRVGASSHPLLHVTLVPEQRHDYFDGETNRLQQDATHASFVTLLTRSARQIETFAVLGGALGHVINGDRR